MAKQKKSPEEIIKQLEAENAENFNSEAETPQEEQQAKNPSFEANGVYKDSETGRYKLSSRKEKNELLDSIDTSMNSSMIGTKLIPMDVLPSKGLFYPLDFNIGIKAATVSEVRNWSVIDENDPIDMNDKMNMIMENCVRVSSNGGSATWKDLKEIDRTALLVKIHELTFPDNQNALMVPFECPECKHEFTVPMTSNMLDNVFNPSDKLMRFYDSSKRCFVINSDKLPAPIEMYPPSLGAMNIVMKKAKELRDTQGKAIDASMIRCLQFFMPNWRSWTDDKFDKFNQNMIMWPMNKFQIISWVVDEFTKCTNLNLHMECEKCGEVLEKPIFFRGGYTLKDFFCATISPDEFF